MQNAAAHISPKAIGHIAALFTALVWGITFVSSKVLLESFSPFEILLSRFTIALLVLFILRPRRLRLQRPADELLFAAAGLTGVVAYFLLENIALTMATASNISVTVSVAPMFIAIFATIIGREHALRPTFIIGFFIAMAGIILISFADTSTASVGWGDLMAIGAAIVWGVYSNIIAVLNDRGYESIAVVKRVFLWGVVIMLGISPFMGVSLDFSRFLNPVNAGNILFLGLLASGCCYITWSYSVNNLGASMAGVYIYLQPAITIVAAILFLGEPFTARIGLGLVLVLAGLLLSEGKLTALLRLPKKQ